MGLIFSASISAQTEVYFEDFEDGSLEGFTLYNLDGFTPDDEDLATMADSAWTVRFITAQGWEHGNSAFSVSWYVNDVGPSNDWLITPPIEIGEASILSWDALAITSSGLFRDRYQVFIGSSAEIEDYFELQPVFDTGSDGELAVPTQRTLDLGALNFENETIYIAFRNTTESLDGNELAIDNIRVSSILSNNNIQVYKDFKVQPNPSAGNFAISMNLETPEFTSFEVLDITGKILRQEVLGTLAPGAHLIEIEREGLADGVYFLRVRSEEAFSVARVVLN
jgi:hypothetical protein